MHKLLLILVALISATLISQADVNAQKKVTYKGITLSPAIQNIELSPDQARKSFKIIVENNQQNAVSLSVDTLDFKSLNESGGVAFIGSNAADLQHKYGLAKWLIAPEEKINLLPKTSKEIEITIDNRQDLSPGGHYAAVLFKNTASGAGGDNNVSFDQVVATLVFLKKTGGEIYALQLKDLEMGSSWLKLPTSVPLFIKNTGNTQTSPRGIVTVIGPGGHSYRKGIINADSGLVLPESTRFFRTPLKSLGYGWMPGYYKAIVSYRADDQENTTTQEYKFLYVNLPLLLVVVLLGVLGFIGYRNFRTWK